MYIHMYVQIYRFMLKFNPQSLILLALFTYLIRRHSDQTACREQSDLRYANFSWVLFKMTSRYCG